LKHGLYATETKLTKEEYLDLGRRGLTDREIFMQCRIGINAFYRLKKEWDLTGLGKSEFCKVRKNLPRARKPEPKQEEPSKLEPRPKPKTQEECFANPVLVVDIQSGRLLVNRLWSWI
jgi:hypothetical protein